MIRTGFISFVFLCGAHVFAQDGDDAQPAGGIPVDDERVAASEEASELLAELTCRTGDPGATTADALPDSILNWSNPDVGRVYGDVFLWLEQGRPVAAASIYRWYFPYDSLTIEFCSLSENALEVERTGNVIWNTADGGIEWKPVPDGGQPARSPALRLTQLKAIARRFSADLADERTDAEGVNKVLRLLPQPVYRYPQQGGATMDGAVFAMVVGTDPELLLILETGGDGWQYAVARMNRDAIDVRIDEQLVASFPHIGNELFDTTRPYCCVVVNDGSRRSTDQP